MIRIFLIIILLTIVLQPYQYNYYFPFLPITNSAIGDSTIYDSSEPYEVQYMAIRLVNHPEQNHLRLERNVILAQTAQEHCNDMANRNYFSHTNPEGYGPNYLARQNGYSLPSGYGQENNSNDIESLGAGFLSPEDALFTLINYSPAHRAHLLGEGNFQHQENFGIGYSYNQNTKYKFYYCFIISGIENVSN